MRKFGPNIGYGTAILPRSIPRARDKIAERCHASSSVRHLNQTLGSSLIASSAYQTRPNQSCHLSQKFTQVCISLSLYIYIYIYTIPLYIYIYIYNSYRS